MPMENRPTHDPVGGIDLRGPQAALGQLVTLRGVAVEPLTGRLVLISDERGAVDLPPLRLEDVATVFRTVYQRGEAPWVTIDPNPTNPRGPTMIVRHGTIDATSYVAWVLFEADRLMKVYSLGQDNESGAPFRSAIDGYRSLLDVGDTGASASTWERFWIRPAAVERRESSAADVPLGDGELMVDTERMVLRNGRLETAAGQQPSRPAQAFASWFTAEYDSVAEEATSSAPRGGGIEGSVKVFQELRRIAVIAGVAEALRDQGVPFPRWMADVPVSPAAVP